MPKQTPTAESIELESETEAAGHAARFVVIFPDGLAEKVRKEAKDQDKLVSELVREIVRDFITDGTVECEECSAETSPGDASFCSGCGLKFSQDEEEAEPEQKED